MFSRALRPLTPFVAMALAVVAAAACPGRRPGQGERDDAPAGPPARCDRDSDCGEGAFCGEERTCVEGDCDPALEDFCDFANLESPFCCASDQRDRKSVV